jgi:hypothetical protein
MIVETYTRVFVDADALDRTSAFYQGLLDGKESLRFAYPETGLEPPPFLPLGSRS